MKKLLVLLFIGIMGIACGQESVGSNSAEMMDIDGDGLKTTQALVNYPAYVTDDLVGTAGNGIRDKLAFARPTPIRFCDRPKSYNTKPWKAGLLFVSTSAFRSTMGTKAAPLNKMLFRTVNTTSNNSSITNTVAYNTNYNSETPLHLVYFHQFPPMDIEAYVYTADGSVGGSINSTPFLPENIEQIGCYEVRYDNQVSSSEYYWLSVVKTKIKKDALVVLETLDNPTHTDNSSNTNYGKVWHRRYDIIRQGTTTNWVPTLTNNGLL
jgi:hypothetical protein